MKSKVKKVIAISSGHGDLNFINQSGVEVSSYYAALKAALNVIVAKFSAQYKEQGVLFASMSPGVVEVGHFADGMFSPQLVASLTEVSRNDGTDGKVYEHCWQARKLRPRLQRANTSRASHSNH